MAQYKDKSRGTWWYEFRAKDPLTGKMIPHKKRGFPTKGKAKEAERQKRLIVQNKQGRIKLYTLIELYLTERGGTIKESTRVDDKSYYNNHLKEYFDQDYIDEITSSKIEMWKKQKIEMNIPGKDRKYAPKTINSAKLLLSKYLSFAVDKGLLLVNPCKAVKKYVDPDAITPEFTNYLEHSDFIKLIENTDNPLWADVFTFLMESGLRSGEFMALQWDCIDLANRKVYIRRNLTYKSESEGRKITTPKTKRSRRAIDMQDSLYNILEPRYRVALRGDGYKETWFVFGGVLPISKTTLANSLDKYIKIAGIKRITPHGFRHSHATELITAGINDTLIAERLGHSVEELHRTYAHVYQKTRNHMLDHLNNRSV